MTRQQDSLRGSPFWPPNRNNRRTMLLIAEQTSVGRERGLQAQFDGAAQIDCAATEAEPGVPHGPPEGVSKHMHIG